MVRTRGFEPPRREAQAPQACVSTVPPRAQLINMTYLKKKLRKLL